MKCFVKLKISFGIVAENNAIYTSPGRNLKIS